VTVEEIAIKRERLRDASTMADFEALVREYGLTLKEVSIAACSMLTGACVPPRTADRCPRDSVISR
jgi:hypothetical protein